MYIVAKFNFIVRWNSSFTFVNLIYPFLVFVILFLKRLFGIVGFLIVVKVVRRLLVIVDFRLDFEGGCGFMALICR